jgi:hypothetical protein
MLFRRKFAVYCDIHMKHTNTDSWQKAQFYYVKSGGIYIVTTGYDYQSIKKKDCECVNDIKVSGSRYNEL